MVKLVESSRGAWQGLPLRISSEVKADYLKTLVAAGFRHLDAVAFVEAAALPQMTDSGEVLGYLDPPDDVEVIALVLEPKGVARAARTGAVHTVTFPYAVSATFLEQNQQQTPEESLEALEAIGEAAYKAGLDVTASLEMAFGNPFGEPWEIDEVVAACDLLVDSGVLQITLVDSTGQATPKAIADLMQDVMAVHDEVEIGLELHARPAEVAAKIAAAYTAGCRRFSSSIGALGSCRYAADAMVGKVATEQLLQVLQGLGAELPELRPLDGLVQAASEIGRRFGARVQ
ncbi:MAG: hydroxymethylglutaryl-CoA lyase [Acidobacteriota bacterium]|nr:hydroxymethylglutaryl-CoA lyase [Acidobacteriota bacterium]